MAPTAKSPLYMRIILLVTGCLNLLMIAALLSPHQAMEAMFGVTGELNPAMEIMVRSWGALVVMLGVLLLAAAFYSALVITALLFAGSSKLVFVLLCLLLGQEYLDHLQITLVIDVVTIVIFIWLIFNTHRQARH